MECYCQAANASSAVLMMLEKLSMCESIATADANIPPVTTMTTVGKDVRVWLAYVCTEVSSKGNNTKTHVKLAHIFLLEPLANCLS